MRSARITYFDSYRASASADSDKRVLSNLRRFMEDLDRETGRPERAWKTLASQDSPQQENWWDCGVFMLMTCRWRAYGLPFSFDQDDMDDFRRRILADIIDFSGPPPLLARAKRGRDEPEHGLLDEPSPRRRR